MACPDSAQKIDSNFTGLRYAFEVCISNLPGDDDGAGGTESFGTSVTTIPPEELGASSPTWHVLEPNSYADFGATISTTQRIPISSSRQRERGVVTDLDASAGFQIDFTVDNLERLLPCFMFAAWRRSGEFGRSSQETIGGIASGVVDGTDIEDGFQVGSLVILRNFDVAANNTGVYRVTDVTGPNAMTVNGVADDAGTAADAYVKEVGFQGVAGDIDVDASGARPALTSTALDFTTLNLAVGQWVYIGGDTAATAFTNAGNNGFARIFSIAAARLEFDKTQNTMVTEASTTETVQLFFGDYIRNEDDPTLILRQTLQLERSLSTAGFEYVLGAVANQLTINVSSADKVTADLAFIGTDSIQFDSGSRKSGTFPSVDTANTAFNTSSDFSRIRLASNSAFQTPLFAFITELTLTINNNITPTKAVGTLGSFEATAGDFVAEGSITAYFSDIAAVQAVRNNTEVSLDFAMVVENAGWIFDIPSINLGEGRLNVEKDNPITLPLSLAGARDDVIGASLLAVYFPYLPNAAG